MTSASELVCYRFGRFELQPEERRLLADGVVVRLGGHALDLLLVFVERSGHLVSKDELLERVWHQVVVEENTLQSHIAALRKVLGAGVIATVSGQGYRFVPEVSRVDKSSADGIPTRKHNLPNELTAFIGRARESEQVAQLLGSSRLLTITGAGGCGKTRLALEVARGLLPGYADGVWLVELAPLGDPSLICQTVASALAVKEQPGKGLEETVSDWLAPRHLLLVLDNAEHLLGACARLADLLLRRCARLTILVTSRERLAIAGELSYRVPSLAFPNSLQGATHAETVACEAAQLFIARARLLQPEFNITEKEAPALVSICRRLDGIALAIELAAPRIRSMSVEELSKRLDDRFGLLTGGSRAALPRHRTLRSLIDWSYDLLSDPEKALLRRTSVFAGTWTLDAAEQVCADAEVGQVDVLELLTSLADKNLVVTESGGGETRFRMLDTVRHYARDRLRDSGEEADHCSRHVHYFLKMAERLDQAQDSQAMQVALSQLDAERDNIRAALSWCETTDGLAETGLRLAGRLYWFWSARAAISESLGWINRALAATPSDRPGEAQAMALHVAGTMSAHNDNASAEIFHHQALHIWERLGDRSRILRSVGSLGNVAFERNDLATARERYEQALAVAREIDDRRSIALGLISLGIVNTVEGDYSAAQEVLEEAVVVSRAVNLRATAQALMQLGWIQCWQEGYARARALFTEAVDVFRSFGDEHRCAIALVGLATIAAREGHLAEANAQLREAHRTANTAGNRSLGAYVLEGDAELALASRLPLVASRLLSAAKHLREEIGRVMRPDEKRRYEKVLAEARSAANDDSAFDDALQQGQQTSLDEAMQYARDALALQTAASALNLEERLDSEPRHASRE